MLKRDCAKRFETDGLSCCAVQISNFAQFFDFGEIFELSEKSTPKAECKSLVTVCLSHVKSDSVDKISVYTCILKTSLKHYALSVYAHKLVNIIIITIIRLIPTMTSYISVLELGNCSTSQVYHTPLPYHFVAFLTSQKGSGIFWLVRENVDSKILS